MQEQPPKQKGVRVTTSSVAQTIEHFCKEKNIPLQKIDFDLLGFKTEISSSTTDEKPKTATYPVNEQEWLDKTLSFRQSYDIFLRFATPSPDFQLQIGFGGNKSLTSVLALIKPTSVITNLDNVEDRIENELNKRKLKLGMLVGIYDENMKKGIKSLADYLRNGSKLEREFKIELFNGPEFIPTRDDKLDVVFQKSEDGNVKPGVFSTTSGSTVMVYVKAKLGKESRDAKGRFLEVVEPKITNETEIKVGEGIEIIDSEDERVYKAKKTGFIVFDGTNLDVTEEMALHEVSLKTGSIDAGMDANAKLDITDDNPDSEAIGDNMSVRAAVVNVQGSVGANAKIEAKEVSIGGQTHRTSKIVSVKAKIKNHKGYIEADEVEIETLEGGEVVAKKAVIGTTVGGKIKADECYIKVMGNNNIIETTKLVEIEKPQGGENRISVEAAANASDMKQLTDLEAKISKLQKSIEEKDEYLKKELKDIESATSSVNEIKAKIEEERKKNSPLANVLLAKLKHFSVNVDKAKEVQKVLEDEKEELKHLLEEADLLQYRVLDAKIKAMDTWQGYNFVSFKLIYPPREFTYKVMEGSEKKEIILKKISEVDYEIFAL